MNREACIGTCCNVRNELLPLRLYYETLNRRSEVERFLNECPKSHL
ncbi:Uncharacterised protein [Vibrio cholerae]|nr:Uncharacterised protein [Vibrio cholerae]